MKPLLALFLTFTTVLAAEQAEVIVFTVNPGEITTPW